MEECAEAIAQLLREPAHAGELAERGRERVRDGRSYLFCSESCRARFRANPARFVQRDAAPVSPRGEMKRRHWDDRPHSEEAVVATRWLDSAVEHAADRAHQLLNPLLRVGGRLTAGPSERQ